VLVQAPATPRMVRCLRGGRTRRGTSFDAQLTASSRSTVTTESSVSESVSQSVRYIPCHCTVFPALRGLRRSTIIAGVKNSSKLV